MTKELVRRIAITIGALLVFRVGTHIPVAGIATQGGVLSSGGVYRVSIFALTLIPYISAAILIQLLSMVWGRLSALERSGEAGRRRLARYTLILTLLLASFQAFGLASAMQNISGLVTEPGAWFLLSASASMVGGVFFMVWLSEQITRHGIGNGIAALLAVSILISLPPDVAKAIEMTMQGLASPNLVLFNVLFCMAMIALVVFVETARRNVRIEFAARQIGKRLLPPRSAVLPIKINSAGFLVPVTVASWLIHLPVYLFVLPAFVFGSSTDRLTAAYQHVLAPPIYLPVMSIASLVLVFIYTAYVLDPEQAAETLAEQGAVVPGVEPGEATADYLDRAVSLTTILGAVYLVGLLLIPQALLLYGKVLPYNISGGSALIVVCTFLDIRTQVRELSLTNPGSGRQ